MSDETSSSDSFPRKFGKYHLLAPLAQGGMGALYLAVTGDRGFERLLCIKTVLPHLADKEYVARFRDEAKIVVQLSHGNLIPVFDAGQVDGELFLAMDFVKGKDLRAVWNRCAQKGVAFPVDVAVFILKELCRGLGYAHSHASIGLVHRDVSPPNVLVSYAGEVKLTDFGLASSTQKLEKTVPGIIYGKVAYMSPEQARGESLDGRSDVYACGIVLWELLTGRQLFPPGKEQPQDLLKRAKNPTVMKPSKRAPRVPAELDAIVLRALEADRNKRYETAEEFRDALNGWLADNYPATDADRVHSFLYELFAEDIAEEEEARQELIEQTRDRMRTLPPTDELRMLLRDGVGEEGESVMDTLNKVADRRRAESEGPHPGRRAPDQGEEEVDRRGGGRRAVDKVVDKLDHTVRGLAVKVAVPGPRGKTIVGTEATESQAAVAYNDQDDDADLIGRVLDGRYHVERLIGEGGMGRVYLAEHVDIGKKFAIKVLHPVYGRMPDLVERFRREARAASRIGHPNIVDVTDSGTTNAGSVYFVMEYLDGVELAGAIEKEGAIDIPRALHIAAQTCRALSAAHAAGIIHRDLKPENVFLTSRDGTSDFVKILDFGIAKSSEQEEARARKLTSPGMAMGTPEYMAPEQAAGKVADERCDVYAVGAILYEMLTGTAPYEGANFMEILTKKATLEPTPARALRPEIPEEVELLLQRAMARLPENRPSTMEALQYELTKCLSGRGAAVANILGIAQDDSFEPTLSTGRFRVPTETGRAATLTPPPPVTPTSATQPIETTPPPRTASETSGEMAVSMDSADGVPLQPAPEIQTGSVPNVSGSGLRVIGWALFMSFLMVAGGTIVYVVTREQNARATPEAVEAAARGSEATEVVKVAPAGAAGDTGEAASKEVEAEVPANEDESTPADPGEEAGGELGGEKDLAIGTHELDPSAKDAPAEPSPKITGRGNRIPSSEKEARALLAEADKAFGKTDWRSAKQAYERVARSKYQRQDAYLGLANVAFQQSNHAEAISFAKKAGKGKKARMTLGNAYFKAGEVRRALDIYNAILDKNPGYTQAQDAAAAARKKLGLP